ncbi:DNA repair protein crb2 [Podospora australis]|uniref:DNA repair protein crb2 n=1 Tax=Podospora australis TaxID=1536484 RepID=A0AAN7AMY6_9PEZI|nr:DNA repair protein crb2 [Podospora australis]
MPSRTLRQAEKEALEGSNESQDTLEVAELLMRDYGVGLTSSSPPRGRVRTSASRNRSITPPGDINGLNGSTRSQKSQNLQLLKTRGTREETTTVHKPCINLHGSLPGSGDGNNDEAAHALTDIVSQPTDVVAQKKKMDSQASTQSNTGRSYDRYFHDQSSLPPTQAPGLPTRNAIRTSSPVPAPLEDDEGGTVQFNFDQISRNDKPVSSNQADSGVVDFGSLRRLRKQPSEDTSLSPTAPLPETPAPPKNPFRHSRSQLLPASQLFMGTQFSSAVKVASPTSSRPSPTGFPVHVISNPATSSPLKNRGLRSSPEPDLPSSSQLLPGPGSPKPIDQPSSPVRGSSTGELVIPATSSHSPKEKLVPEPMAAYEPMRKFQERRSISELRSDPAGYAEEEDDDDDDEIRRRRRAKFKKDAGLKSLNAISFARPPKPPPSDVAPRERRRKGNPAEAYIAQCYGTELTECESEDTETIKDSQGRKAVPAQNPIIDDESTQSDVDDGPEHIVELTPAQQDEPPVPTTSLETEVIKDSLVDATATTEEILETSPAKLQPHAKEPEVQSSRSPVPEVTGSSNFTSSPPAFSTRSNRANVGDKAGVAPSTTSSLSDLSSTPVVSACTTPSVDDSVAMQSPLEVSVVANSSPIQPKTKRRETRQKVIKPKTSTESIRQSSRLSSRRGSSSTDELSRGLSATPAFEQSLRVSRFSMISTTSRSASRSGRASLNFSSTPKAPKLFDGMAFAISFQARRPGESNEQFSARMDLSSTIATRIKQAGGRLLNEGFDELFELSPPVFRNTSTTSAETETEIRLTPAGRSIGFTALIADGHSRKVKYMQALALGLPCIAARWVSVCLEKQEVVDWSPFLLCAGESSFLGDAIRSRNLMPYDPSTAQLSEVISRREKFMQGSKILAVVKKAGEQKKIAYVFLARVLGASLTRVYTVDEAKAAAKAAEDSGHPFNWVYVDGKSAEQALFSAGSTTANKKRKRASTAADKAVPRAEDERPCKRIRTLSDELVIQSLILGRLIEEEDMNG